MQHPPKQEGAPFFHQEPTLPHDPRPTMHRNWLAAARAADPAKYGHLTEVNKRDPHIQLIWAQHRVDFQEKLKAWRLRHPGGEVLKRKPPAARERADSSSSGEESATGKRVRLTEERIDALEQHNINMAHLRANILSLSAVFSKAAEGILKVVEELGGAPR